MLSFWEACVSSLSQASVVSLPPPRPCRQKLAPCPFWKAYKSLINRLPYPPSCWWPGQQCGSPQACTVVLSPGHLWFRSALWPVIPNVYQDQRWDCSEAEIKEAGRIYSQGSCKSWGDRAGLRVSGWGSRWMVDPWLSRLCYLCSCCVCLASHLPVFVDGKGHEKWHRRKWQGWRKR